MGNVLFRKSCWILLLIALPDYSSGIHRQVCNDDGTSDTIGTCLDAAQVTLILTVFKRKMLLQQLLNAAQQSFRPSVIFVYQNERHVDAQRAIDDFQKSDRSYGIPVKLVRSDENFKFHGRFLLPLAFRTEYTCVWDDDILPGVQWLEHVFNVSRRLGGALIGGNGRNILEIGEDVIQEDVCDDCTSECVEQQASLDRCAHKENFSSDEFATFRTYNSSFPVRFWLFCACLRAGFKPLKCSNCDEQNITSCEEEFFDVLHGFSMTDWTDNHTRFFERLYSEAPNRPVSERMVQRAQATHLVVQLRMASQKFRSAKNSVRALLIVHGEQDLVKTTPFIWELGQSVQIVLIRDNVDSEIPTQFFKRHDIPLDFILLDQISPTESLEARAGSLISEFESIITFPLLSPNVIVTVGDSFSLVACIFVGFKFHIPVANIKTELHFFGPSQSIPPVLTKQLENLASMLRVSTHLSSPTRSARDGDRSSIILGSSLPSARGWTDESAHSRAVPPTVDGEKLRTHRPEHFVLIFISAERLPIDMHRRVFHSISRLLEEADGPGLHFAAANGMHIVLPMQTRALFDLAGETFAGNSRVHATPPMSLDGLRQMLAGVDLVLTDSAAIGGACKASDTDKPVLILNHSLLQGPAGACHGGGVEAYCGFTEPYLQLFRRALCDTKERDTFASDLQPSSLQGPPRLEDFCPALLPCTALEGPCEDHRLLQSVMGRAGDKCDLKSAALEGKGVIREDDSNAGVDKLSGDVADHPLDGAGVNQPEPDGTRVYAPGPPLPKDFLPFSEFENREEPDCYSRIRSACVNMSTGDVLVFRPPEEEAGEGGPLFERLKTCYYPHCSGLNPPCTGFGLVGVQTVFDAGGLGGVLEDHGPAAFEVDGDGAAFLSTWTVEGSLWHVILDNIAGFWANVKGLFGVSASATDDGIECPDLRVFFTNDILHRRDEARCISTAVGHTPGAGCGMWKDSLGLLFYSAFSRTASDAVSVLDLQHAAGLRPPEPPLQCYKEVFVGYPPVDLGAPWPDTMMEYFGDCLVRNSLKVPWGRRRWAASRPEEAVLLIYSRGGCPRRIDNLAELEAGVRARYSNLRAVRTARFEELAPADQLAAAADADVLVGPHGSGMGWMAVMPRDGVAVVLRGYPNEYPRDYEKWGRQVDVHYVEWAARDPALITLCADPAMPVEERARARGSAVEMGQSFVVPPDELFVAIDDALAILEDT